MTVWPPGVRREGHGTILSGEWTLAAMLPQLPGLRQELRACAARSDKWDLSAVTRLDSAAATLLWLSWGKSWPGQVDIPEHLRVIVDRAAAGAPVDAEALPADGRWLLWLGSMLLTSVRHALGVIALFGQMLLDLFGLMRRPSEFPWREVSANLYKSGARALPVAGMIGFLIGVTISYLSALQLKLFGADVYIVNILGISIVRELGPVLVAVLVAGRSGSAMTAQIGVMRVTEEIDALAVMGISRTRRVVLPKVLALTLAMPLLVVWTSAVALFGGMVAANLQLDLSFGYFIEALPSAVPIGNLVIGLCKGAVFGFLVALLACYFGLNVRPNTESLSAYTTLSVVASITMVILVDALFAVFTRDFGIPSL